MMFNIIHLKILPYICNLLHKKTLCNSNHLQTTNSTLTEGWNCSHILYLSYSRLLINTGWVSLVNTYTANSHKYLIADRLQKYSFTYSLTNAFIWSLLGLIHCRIYKRSGSNKNNIIENRTKDSRVTLTPNTNIMYYG